MSIGFSRQEYWGGFPLCFPKGLSDPGIKPASPALQAAAGSFFTNESPGKPLIISSLGKYFELLACFYFTLPYIWWPPPWNQD